MLKHTVLAAALLAAGAAQAQLKPPADPGTLPARPTLTPAPAPSAPAANVDPVIAAKEAAAVKAAAAWLKLIDDGQYEKSWDETASIFRQKVPRSEWANGLPKNRAEYGKFNARQFDQTQFRRTMPGAPDGEYVAVRFISDFEKNAAADEIVTMMFDNGAWRPIGYLLR